MCAPSQSARSRSANGLLRNSRHFLSRESRPKNRVAHLLMFWLLQASVRRFPVRFPIAAKWRQQWHSGCPHFPLPRRSGGPGCRSLRYFGRHSSKQSHAAALDTLMRFRPWSGTARQSSNPEGKWTLQASARGLGGQNPLPTFLDPALSIAADQSPPPTNSPQVASGISPTVPASPEDPASVGASRRATRHFPRASVPPAFGVGPPDPADPAPPSRNHYSRCPKILGLEERR